MIIRNVTNLNDWTFGKGIQNYKTNKDAILLNVKTRLQSWVGDCFYATAEGVDYNNYMDIGTKDFLDSDIKRIILQSEGILKINSYVSTLDRDTREFEAQAEIVTIFGIGSIIL